MAEPPLVSVVMPTYNRAALVGKAIEAVLAQTYRNVELIVVNDGSRDNTDEVLARHAAQDVRVSFYSKPNEGIPDTLNYGFERTRGEYVTWTSDDNFYHADAIQTMVGFLDAHRDVAMCYTDVNDVDAQGSLLRVVDTGEPERLDPTRADCHCGVRGCLLYRRGIMESVGPWNRRWVRCHDLDYYIRIYRLAKVAHIPKAVYDYMCHDASMTGNYEAIALEEAELLSHYCPGTEHRARIWAPRYAAIAAWFEKRGEWGRAFGYARKAAALDPHYNDLVRWARRAWLYSLAPAPVRSGWRGLKTVLRGVPRGRFGDTGNRAP